MRAVFIGFVGAVLAGEASAQTEVYEAKTRQLSAHLTVKTDRAGKTTAEYDLISHGCVGGMSGDIIKISDKEMRLNAVGGAQCTVKITKKGASVILREMDGSDCGALHGASCAFDQVLTKRR